MSDVIDLLNLRGGRRTPYIPQAESSECALACLAMVASHHGCKIDLHSLRQRFNVSLKGATLYQLSFVADALGLQSRALQADIGELELIDLPAILHWNLNHFVVLVGIERGLWGTRYRIHDPARGVVTMREAQFSQHYTGVVLELHKGESFRTAAAPPRLQVSQLWTSITGFWSALRQVFLLSLVLQLITLVTPFYMQSAVDDALPASDGGLLVALAVGFAALTLFNYVVMWIRALVVLSFSSSLSYQIVVNLFRHLMRLPMGWFEQRHVGDVVSRFNSTLPISNLLSQGLVTGMIDGAFSITTLVLMIVYAPILAVIAVAALALYAALRFGFLRSLRFRNIDSIATAARENSIFMESARGIQAIKAFGQEIHREHIWQKAKADAVNAQLKLGRLNAAFDALNQFVIGGEQILFVYLAVHLAIAGDMTIGMVFAFQAYKQQFMGAGIRLIEQTINWRILQVHLARISDIALSKPEDARHQGIAVAPHVGRIELRNIYFRYGIGDPDILKGVNLTIESGEFLALIGPSGGGKSTVAKLLLGLMEPSHGQILLDDRPIDHYSLRSLRDAVASVSQDDVLYAGTIADNICFWDPEPDHDRIRAAAAMACIDEDVMKMPLGYDTLVGDMGSALSGGQKARVFIARALYRRPRILVLDEATAQLDPGVEKAIVENIAALDIVRVVVTHRIQPTRYADRVMRVDRGQILPVRQNRDKLPAMQLVERG